VISIGDQVCQRWASGPKRGFQLSASRARAGLFYRARHQDIILGWLRDTMDYARIVDLYAAVNNIIVCSAVAAAERQAGGRLGGDVAMRNQVCLA
jgi:hypothetical protein